MNKRNPILIAALMVAFVLGGAYAKSYEVTFHVPTVAGSVELPPGLYRLEFKDSTATLTNTVTGKGYKIPAKATEAEQKFKSTVVDSDNTVNPQRLRFIELSGSTTRLEFGK
jgi:hypothetical protein